MSDLWHRAPLLAAFVGHADGGEAMADTDKTPEALLDQLAARDPPQRREVAAALRSVAARIRRTIRSRRLGPLTSSIKATASEAERPY